MSLFKIFRFLKYYAVMHAGTIYYFGLGLFFLIWKPKDKVLQWVGSRWGSFCLKNAGLHLQVEGLVNLDKRPAIFILNHQSTLDVFIVSALAPFKTLPIAKKSLKWIPVFGFFLKTIGVVLLDRHNPQKAMLGMRQAQKITKNGYSIIMAPEGTRTGTKEIQRFKRGAFHLAVQTKLPLIPIIIKNAFEHQIRSQWIPTPGIVHVKILEPIITKDWVQPKVSQYMTEVQKIFTQHL